MSEPRISQILDLSARGKVLNATGAAALATTLAPGVRFRLHEVRIHLSEAGASGNFTATVDAAAGAAYDAVILTQDMTTITDLIWQSDRIMQFEAGDEINFAWANAGTKTYGLTIIYDLL